MNENNLVSVVICTRNRAAQLEKALLSWCNVDRERLKEIIVVDNGSEDETLEVVENISKNTTIIIRYLYQGVVGVSAARNKGLVSASGEIISFSDDDCYPSTDFISEVVKVFEENPTVGFVGGRVLLFDPTDLPITLQTSEKIIKFPLNKFFRAGLIHGANFSIKSSQVKNRFLFDERFGPGSYLISAEDTDFINRLLWNCVPGIFHPGPVVYHHHGRKTADVAKKLHNSYSIGRGAYYMKCFLNSKTRSACIEHFYSELRRDFDKKRILEIWGAIKFLRVSSTEQNEWKINAI
jgi:glycosyltransferase involved in cell wall biosynthesis